MPNTGTVTATSSASAVPTVAGLDIATPVRLVIGDSDATNQEFTDSDLSNLLTRAITYYQRLRPYTLETTITLVANQSDYLLPSDCVRPIYIPYRVFAGLNSPLIVAYMNLLTGSAEIVPYKDWSDMPMNKIRQEWGIRFDTIGAGQSEVVDYLTSYAPSKYIRLYPTPTAAGSFVLRYQAQHPLQGNNYFTVPSYHAIWVQKLLEAEVYDARAAKMANTATTFGAGTTKLDFSKAIDTNYKLANALRQEVMDALNRPVGMIG